MLAPKVLGKIMAILLVAVYVADWTSPDGRPTDYLDIIVITLNGLWVGAIATGLWMTKLWGYILTLVNATIWIVLLILILTLEPEILQPLDALLVAIDLAVAIPAIYLIRRHKQAAKEPIPWILPDQPPDT